MTVTHGQGAGSWPGGPLPSAPVDPLAGYAVPSAAEIDQARAVRGQIVVADRRDQMWARMPVATAMVVTFIALVNLVLAAARLSTAGALGWTLIAGLLTLMMVVATLVNLVVLVVAQRRLFARGVNWREQLLGPRFPDRVPVQPLLVSSGGLAALVVTESARGIRAERIADVLGMPASLAVGWAQDLSRRGLVSVDAVAHLCQITPLGRRQLDRVLGPRA